MDVNCVAEVATGIDWSKIWPAILGTILSVLVTVILFFIKNNIDKKIREENQRKSEIETLDKQLDDILKIAISYPYLETKKFCDTWDVKKAEEGEDIDKYQRYNVFCNLVFYCAEDGLLQNNSSFEYLSQVTSFLPRRVHIALRQAFLSNLFHLCKHSKL